MEKLKLKSRNLTSEEKYKIAEFLVDEYNETFFNTESGSYELDGDELGGDEDLKLTMEEIYDDFDDASLLVAYDFPDGEVFIIFGTFYSTDYGVEKAIDEFIIGIDGEIIAN